MKVVLFCGGLGTRIRDYSEHIPKPMIPVGQQPILWHLLQYYSHYGHRDFVLCMGYKANVIREFFMNYRPTTYGDVVVSDYGRNIEMLGPPPPDWRITMVDTGLWRNIGERLLAVREHVKDEPMFMANYSDGLSDVPLEEVQAFFEKSGAIACFMAVQPNFSYHLIEMNDGGQVTGIKTSHSSEVWINGGFFIFRQEIFDYIKPGEELVLEPFSRLIAEGKLVAYKYKGFWASMDTLKDKQILEDMVEKGRVPWQPWLKDEHRKR